MKEAKRFDENAEEIKAKETIATKINPKKDEATNGITGIKYICQCDCLEKTIRSVRKSNLLNGNSTSCGCDRESKGEKKIKQILFNNNIYHLHLGSIDKKEHFVTRTSKLLFFTYNENEVIFLDVKKHPIGDGWNKLFSNDSLPLNFSLLQRIIFKVPNFFSNFYMNIAKEDKDIGLKTFHGYIVNAIENIKSHITIATNDQTTAFVVAIPTPFEPKISNAAVVKIAENVVVSFRTTARFSILKIVSRGTNGIFLIVSN